MHNTGRTIGEGSYAAVQELNFCGLKCVGKKIHTLLYKIASDVERNNMLRNFGRECELLSRLHHPCIVQFLGVYCEDGSQLPILVMEYLHTTLASCLDKHGVLPEEISYRVLSGVALGLRYLHEHSPPIIHRDLSANNVLLTTDMSAKISDLGVAKMLNLSPAKMTQIISTQAPGTPCYMPPEALVSTPSYTSKIDSYSYGVMMIHVLCGRWPFPADAFRADPEGSLTPVTEFDRRTQYLHEIGMDHPLIGLIEKCLSNTPRSRPEASEILVEISALASQFPPSFQSKVEAVFMLKDAHSEAAALREESELRSTEVESQRNETEALRQQTEALVKKNNSQAEQVAALKSQIDQSDAEIESQRKLIEVLRWKNEALEHASKSQSDQVEPLKNQLDQLNLEAVSQREAIEGLRWENEALKGENESLGEQLETLKMLKVKASSNAVSTPTTTEVG